MADVASSTVEDESVELNAEVKVESGVYKVSYSIPGSRATRKTSYKIGFKQKYPCKNTLVLKRDLGFLNYVLLSINKTPFFGGRGDFYLFKEFV